MRLSAREFLQARQLEHLADTVIDIILRHVAPAQTEGDVLVNAQMRKQGVRLEHHVHRTLVGRDRRDILAGQFNDTGGRRLETGQHAHHRCLAAARRPKQGKKFLLEDIKRKIIDRREITKAFCHGPEADQRFLAGVIPRGKDGLVHDVSFLRPWSGRKPKGSAFRRCPVRGSD